MPSRMVCQGCGLALPAGALEVFRCSAAVPGDDVDHLLHRRLDPAAVDAAAFDDAEPNPFVRYRTLFHSHAVAGQHGIDDAAFTALVGELDAAIAEVDGRGFRATPLAPAADLAVALGLDAGALWIKDETGNVGGSHKARHLMGIALWLEVVERLGAATGRRLAIASCGNAALAAAIVARAARRPLDVFIPPAADPLVVERLEALGAALHVCRRAPGMTGDPCFHRFRDAVEGGALPFTVQGTENGLTIEGGATLGAEMVSTLVGAGRRLDALFVQVGGGALASATWQAFEEARALGRLDRLPRLVTVQTTGAYPLWVAYQRVVERIVERTRTVADDLPPAAIDDPRAACARAEWIADHATAATVDEAVRHAARHRSLYMEPWPEPPHSVATGILDDETYDWLAIVRGMLTSRGFPLVVADDLLVEANVLTGRHTGIDADETGTAAVAGTIALARAGLHDAGDVWGALVTGCRRRQPVTSSR